MKHDDEEYYENPGKQKEKFPSIEDKPSVDLSIIIPAYEEELRCKFKSV